jgi:hypothetical protein
MSEIGRQSRVFFDDTEADVSESDAEGGMSDIDEGVRGDWVDGKGGEEGTRINGVDDGGH